MHTYLLDMLQCPACHEELVWRIDEQIDNRIEAAEARCAGCAASYPVRDGIGIFLTPDLPRNDLWEQVDSGLIDYLHRHPDIEQQLVDGPPEELSPADQFFRAMVLEDRGNFGAAQEVEDLANERLYTPATVACRDSQLEFVIGWLSQTAGPVVDLASGRCYLAGRIARSLDRHVVATDFSLSVLRRNRRWLQSQDLYERVSLLAFDARRTPFKDGAVGTLTTNLGLPNVQDPRDLLKELKRIVDGVFLAVSHFYPEDDALNGEVIHEAGMEKSLYRQAAVDQFAEAGWQVEVKNACTAQTRPTPAGVILEGARIDSFPVADTQLEWCVLLGRS